jgi:hypothetical protein
LAWAVASYTFLSLIISYFHPTRNRQIFSSVLAKDPQGLHNCQVFLGGDILLPDFSFENLRWSGGVDAGFGRGLFLEEVFCLRGMKSQWGGVCDTRPAQMSRTMLHGVLSQ